MLQISVPPIETFFHWPFTCAYISFLRFFLSVHFVPGRSLLPIVLLTLLNGLSFLLMSLAIGVESSSSKSKSDMGFDENKEEGKKGKENQEGRKPEGAEEEVETGGRIERKQSESSICDVTEDEDESDVEPKIELGPQFTIKQQLEKDKVCLPNLGIDFSFLVPRLEVFGQLTRLI